MNKEISKVVSRAKEHDADAFMQLVQPYTKKMYQTALSILVNDEDAADAIQETILNCWEKIQTLKWLIWTQTRKKFQHQLII